MEIINHRSHLMDEMTGIHLMGTMNAFSTIQPVVDKVFHSGTKYWTDRNTGFCKGNELWEPLSSFVFLQMSQILCGHFVPWCVCERCV